MPPSNKYSTPDGDIRLDSQAKRSSRPQQTSGFVKQKVQSPRANHAIKSQDKRKIKSSFRLPYVDEHPAMRRAGDCSTLQKVSLKNSEEPEIEIEESKKDELVRHMSNLPGYLQKVESEENFQEKALNFGVLEWNRLEKWKTGGSHKASSNCKSKSFARQKRQPPSPARFPRLNPAKEEGFSQDDELSRMKVIQKDFETSLRAFDEHRNGSHQSNTTSRKNSSQIKSERSLRRDFDRLITEKETSSSDCRKYEISNSGKDLSSARRNVISSGVNLPKSSEYLGSKHCPNKPENLVLILPKHSPNSNCPEMVQSSEPKLTSDAKSNREKTESFSADCSSEEVHSEEIYSETPHSCSLPVGAKTNFEPRLMPESFRHAKKLEPLYVGPCSSETPAMISQRKSIDTITPNSKLSSDHHTTESAPVKGRHASPSRRFSFSLGKISRSLSFKDNSAVPGSSATPDPVKLGLVRSELSHRFCSEEDHSAELYPYILHSCPLPTGKKTKDKSHTRLHSLTCENEISRMSLSVNASGSTELDSAQSRHPSPNRKFGFSLGKLSRSFSSKENLNIPKVGTEVSELSDSSNRNKDILHSKSRSSPLRRLLDPIFKGKATNLHPSTETSPSSLTINSNSTFKKESCDEKKPQTSMVQALLQVTARNGLPLFKLVVNNSSDILVAMKNVTKSGKQDADLIYTFYSVHEIKKKSGSWINQVHKEKSYGFGYNIIGQMKGFSRYCTDSSFENLEHRFTQKEFVVSSVDHKQGDGNASELVPNRELCSVIVRVPFGKSTEDGDEVNIGKELTGKEFVEYLEEERFLFGRGDTEAFHKTTVILSGADHSLPKNGVPSSLIQRWISGGSCDCGGWDIGCKLQILTNEDQSVKLPEPSVSSLNRDCFDLFNQGGAHDSKPIFRLAPFKKGIYTVEFNASISLIQALSICIAAITSRQSFGLSEFLSQSEGKPFEQSASAGSSGIQVPSKVQELPTKYVPSPPASPVGRV